MTLLKDGFTLAELTAVINGKPRQPRLIGSLGLFHARGVRTSTVTIHERDGVISLVQSTPAGSPGVAFQAGKGRKRALSSARIRLWDTISAAELQGALQFGSEEALKTLQSEIEDRQEQMLASIELTIENHLLGAIRGKVLDADGSTLHDLYAELGVAERDTVYLDLDNAEADLEAKFDDVRHQAIADGRGYVDTQTQFLALYGKTAWRKFKGHAQVQRVFDRYQEGAWLRAGKGATEVAFELWGFRHIEYVGGLGVGLNDNEIRFLPISAGPNGIYHVRYTPADNFQALNSEGLPLYSWTDNETKSSVEVHVETNPCALCLVPQVLRKGDAGSCQG